MIFCFYRYEYDDEDFPDPGMSRDLELTKNDEDKLVDKRFFHPANCSARCVDETAAGETPPLFFGIQGKGECWCGDTIEYYSHLPASSCNCTPGAKVTTNLQHS